MWLPKDQWTQVLVKMEYLFSKAQPGQVRLTIPVTIVHSFWCRLSRMHHYVPVLKLMCHPKEKSGTSE